LCVKAVFMEKIKIFFAVFIMSFLFSSQANSQDIELIRIPDLEKILNNQDDRIHVINFWATWCGPCVKEFPVFEKVSKQYNNDKVKFLMISLDFPSQIDKQLKPFLRKNSATLDVAVMMDVDYNAWIDKVDRSWQGDIPVTLLFNNAKKQRIFHKGEIDEQGLKKLINESL
jgi:thiol-disulfide isomerase/thioredoxin